MAVGGADESLVHEQQLHSGSHAPKKKVKQKLKRYWNASEKGPEGAPASKKVPTEGKHEAKDKEGDNDPQEGKPRQHKKRNRSKGALGRQLMSGVRRACLLLEIHTYHLCNSLCFPAAYATIQTVGSVEEKLKRYWNASEKGPEGAPASKKVPTEGKHEAKDKEGDNDPQEGKPRQHKKRNRSKGALGRQLMSGRKDPFPGEAPVAKEKVNKYERGKKIRLNNMQNHKLKNKLLKHENKYDLAKSQAARYDLLLQEEAGFLEGDDGEDTCTIEQQDIAEVVDITSASKYFNLTLDQFGPYRIHYTRNGRYLLLGGRRGHVAAMNWHTKQLLCEMNVMESINDIKWLHTETMYAVAQKKWLYMYDNKGIELHCIKKFNDVLRMEFLPYHFLLATCSATGFLQYLDISVGKEVAAICTKSGRLDVMTQNPQNAIIHLGHPTGTVTLWSPNLKEPLVKMLCHRGGVRAIAVDKTGMYMATSGLDKKVNIFDIRTYKSLHSYLIPVGASHLGFSQKDLLAAGCGNVVQVYKDAHRQVVKKPYMCHTVRQTIHGLQFCPYEDVLGIGHGEGFSSMLVPGAGEANFDALECNPYQSKKQRQEWEVKALLEKIQPELITLDPGRLGEIDFVTMEQKHKDRVERLGYDPSVKPKFEPKHKKKGKSASGNLLRRKKVVAAQEQRDEIKKNIQEKLEMEQEKKCKEKTVQLGERSALDRFRK
ncbi:WD repeat-containing protein 46 [Protopterus annectens]|uniref:WD repeat-containing protein 46 n=1 Tax=Protopterus annectens TaxID=7888 RepID=UPI001CFA5664|nr:WD repeat-containing protein 46 [Protopterus annectens]